MYEWCKDIWYVLWLYVCWLCLLLKYIWNIKWMCGNWMLYLCYVILIVCWESELLIYKIYKIDYKKGKENWEFCCLLESFYVFFYKKKN